MTETAAFVTSRKFARAALLCSAALAVPELLVACSAPPRGSIHSAAVDPSGAPRAGANRSNASGTPMQRTRSTVDAMPQDEVRRNFDALPAVAAASRPLAAAPRPSAMTLIDATLAPERPSEVARAADIPAADAATMAIEPPPIIEPPLAPTPPATAPVLEPTPTAAPVALAPAPAPAADGARVAPAEPAAAPEMPPEPSLPQRARTGAPSTAPVNEQSMLRGEGTPPAIAPVTPVAPPVEPTAPTAPPVPPIAPPPTPPTPPASTPPTTPPTTPPITGEPNSAASSAGKPVRLVRAQLASRVRGFGDLTPIMPPSVRAGERFVAYFELGNWTVRTESDGRYLVQVGYKLTILDFAGQPVWTEGPLSARDTPRTPPRDLFITRLVKLPPSLPSGSYVLQIDAVDEATGATASTKVPFSVMAEAK